MAEVIALPKKTAETFAARINQHWRESVQGVVAVGAALIEARRELQHGEFGRLFDGMVPFTERTAQRLMAIARTPQLANPTHASLLPQSWGTLYELSRLDDDAWALALKEGRITPDLQRKEIKAWLRKEPQPYSHESHRDIVEDLDSLKEQYGTIYADPPWQYGNQGTRAATDNHYNTMTVDALCAMPVERAALPDAHLHLWTTNAFLFDAKRVIEAWGFEYKSAFVWVKDQIGIGNYWRVSHEFLLTAVRGDAKRFEDKNLRSWLQAPRQQHSRKPEEVRAMIERASPGPYLELFGRRGMENWTVLGDQVDRGLFDECI